MRRALVVTMPSAAMKQVATHALLLGVPASVVAVFYNGSLFGWHPALMSASYLAVMGEGILTAKAAYGKTKREQLEVHLWCQALATALAAAGFGAIYKNKENMGKPHFTTPHGKLGVATVAGTLGVSAGGLLAHYATDLLPKAMWGSVPLLKSSHKTAGKLVFAAGIASIMIGLQPMNKEHPAHKGNLTYAWEAGFLLGALAIIAAPSASAQRLVKTA